jgi:type II restriction/modification system DNA methylase subunit YeeA
MDMNPDEETAGMIRSAAQIADNVFEIEAKVLEDKMATTNQLNQAEILVDDFYDLMDEIDEELGMIHDVSYMDGHIELIESYIK